MTLETIFMGGFMKIHHAGAHLDQLVRQTRNHHVQLSSMADLKANILMTMASVVITLSARYVTDPDLKWAAMVLITFCLVTLVLAVYTVMPKVRVPIKQGKPPDVNDPEFNLLFFGNFVRLDYRQFENAMEEAMNDPSKSYELQIREIYTLGKFLADKKYRFIRLAYMSFIVGLICSVAVMLIAELLK